MNLNDLIEFCGTSMCIKSKFKIKFTALKVIERRRIILQWEFELYSIDIVGFLCENHKNGNQISI